jgi:hypothetical protein
LDKKPADAREGADAHQIRLTSPDFDGPVPRTRFTFACQQQNKAGVKAALRLNEGFFLTLTQVTEATVKGTTDPLIDRITDISKDARRDRGSGQDAAEDHRR